MAGRPRLRPEDKVKFTHIAIRVDTKKKLDEVAKRLKISKADAVEQGLDKL